MYVHSRKSILCSSADDWGKRTSDSLFDVTMGSHDGAEVCELVGSYLLHLITQKFGNCFGLYRDDGLGVIRNSARNIENIKKELCVIFKKNGLRITTEANIKVINFLDVTLDLNTGKHRPFIKPNDRPIYVHKRSNHPPRILANLPEGINKRLSSISSDADSFNKAAPVYQEALTKSGHTYKLSYAPSTPTTAKTTRPRQRKITWFNPPYSRNVSSNIGKIFLHLIEKEFPTAHVLHKILNRNTVKVSYSCMGNVKDSIASHNKSILAKNAAPAAARDCNCRRRAECPMNGSCLTSAVIYQATVSTNNNMPKNTYIGLTENTFKTRYTNHKASFTHVAKRNSTELSKHVWALKDSAVDFNISWKILRQAKPYDNSSGRCNLCLYEKFLLYVNLSWARSTGAMNWYHHVGMQLNILYEMPKLDILAFSNLQISQCVL
jgi:hypothetical protein